MAAAECEDLGWGGRQRWRGRGVRGGVSVLGCGQNDPGPRVDTPRPTPAHPSEKRTLAVSVPMPDVGPVMSATLPVRSTPSETASAVG